MWLHDGEFSDAHNILFQLLEENIVTFVKNELKKVQKVLSSDYPECSESQREDEEVLDGEDEEQRRSSREAFLKITLHFLRRMKQEELADRLQSSKRSSPCNFLFCNFSENMNDNTKTFLFLMVSGWVKPCFIKQLCLLLYIIIT